MQSVVESNQEWKNWETFSLEINNLKNSDRYETEEKGIAFAQAFSYQVVKDLWRVVDDLHCWDCRKPDFKITSLNFKEAAMAKEIADFLSTLNVMEYAYLIGNLYTQLLPDTYRSNNGVYYTPPILAERLLDLLAAEGADWGNSVILDPACGGGAFLVTVANRILGDYRIKALSAEEKLLHLENHLHGIEIDRFAALLTQCLMDIVVYPESIEAGRRLSSIIRIQDTIQYALTENEQYDVIVGNPPYNRLKLDDKTRKAYARSLYGHANLYGLFIDASLRLKKKNGLIGFVTPTSFLGGKYFSNLRNLLSETAPLLTIDFVDLRNGVFDKVLQETCLVVFGENAHRTVTANKISVKENTYNTVERIGSFTIHHGSSPWVIARDVLDTDLVNGTKDLNVHLSDYGYKVTTGQLVWNRHKTQIHAKYQNDAKPIIWAEAIHSDGKFDFEYKYRKDLKYIKVTDRQDFLINHAPGILVQRTTSKEEERRLQSCILPEDFVKEWDGVVIENHVNLITPTTAEERVSLDVLFLILQSKTVDRLFRCLSGSVAVSASELQEIPLPLIENLDKLERLVKDTQGSVEYMLPNVIEKLVLQAYGLEE